MAKRASKRRTEPTPTGWAGRLDALGQLLYGEQWITPMARDLKIPPDVFTEWAWGRRDLPPDHPIFIALAVMVHHHDKGIAKARENHRPQSGSDLGTHSPWAALDLCMGLITQGLTRPQS
jgi:hypothetical protein